MSNIVLNTKTYSGNGVQNGVASYTERSGGILSAFSQLTGSLRTIVSRDPKAPKASAKAFWKLDVPKVATEASTCACPGQILSTARVKVEVEVPADWTATERTDLVDRLQDLTQDTTFVASVVSLAGPAG